MIVPSLLNHCIFQFIFVFFAVLFRHPFMSLHQPKTFVLIESVGHRSCNPLHQALLLSGVGFRCRALCVKLDAIIELLDPSLLNHQTLPPLSQDVQQQHQEVNKATLTLNLLQAVSPTAKIPTKYTWLMENATQMQVHVPLSKRTIASGKTTQPVEPTD